jgi:hypothetical protein
MVQVTVVIQAEQQQNFAGRGYFLRESLRERETQTDCTIRAPFYHARSKFGAYFVNTKGSQNMVIEILLKVPPLLSMHL